MIYAMFFRVWLLASATHAPVPHVWAAVQAETGRVPASLLLAQSWKESRWTTDAVSRVEIQADGSRARRGGTWRGKFPSRFRGPYFCGASQLMRKTEKACRALGPDLARNYSEAVAHLEEWLAYCKKTGAGSYNLDCALAGYGGGIRFAKKTASKTRPWRYGQHTQRLGRAYEARIRKILNQKKVI